MPDSLRVLLLTHYATPHIGGIEVTAEALAGQLRERGHEVVQIASDADSGSTPEDGERVVRVAAWNGLERRAGVPYPLFGPSLAAEVRQHVKWADVVHAQGFLYMSCIAGLRYARRLDRGGGGGPARVLTEHVGHVEYSSRALNLAERAAIASLGRYAVRAAEAVTVSNERVKAEIESLGPEGPIRVIPSGFDSQRYQPATQDEKEALRREQGWDERPRVLFVGRLVEKKGVDLAIAASEAAGGAFELVLVGPKTLPSVPSTVRLLGPVSAEELRRLYQAADALLLPSRGEGIPISVLEALGCGLPVFLRDDPAFAHHAEEAGDALTLVAPDPAEIWAAVRAHLSDPDRCARSAEEAVRYASRFTWVRVTDRYEELYRELLSARSRRAR